MNTYTSLRKQNNGYGMTVISLAMCVVLSATVLFSRLVGFAPADPQHYIPLTKSAGTTVVREGFRNTDGTVTFRGYNPGNHRLLTAKPGFRVYDDNTVWSSQTEVEIFKITYENGAGQVTVRSADGKKVIAPGTENTYKFTLENTGKVPLEYEMSMEAWFGEKGDPDATEIPVLAHVKDYKGNYLAGTGDAKDPVLKLNDVSQKGHLSAGYVAPCTLEWEWLFEGDDVLDTMLGNLAVDEDITLTIQINVTSWQTKTPSQDSGIPKTGDSSHIRLAFTVMMVSGTCLLILPLLPRRKRRENHET